MTCRTLRPGEEIPKGRARRYPTTDGYIRLRWTIGPNEEIEALEHRVVMASHVRRPLAADEHVHHVNHERTDNRIENLVLMTKAEHDAQHAIEKAVPIVEIVALDQAGLTITQVGEMVGLHHSQISRRLAREGVPTRVRERVWR